MRTVMVTGASSGIGLACAEGFLAQGDRVVACYRSGSEAVEALVARFGGDRVVAARADLGEEEGCVRAFSGLAALDVLVHAAGIWNDGEIASLSREKLEEIYRVNTFSAYYLAREAVRLMERGSLIVIGSTAGERGEPGHSHYAGSKAALWGLVQSLAQELAPHIRVNMVSPGWVMTPMSAPAFSQPGRLDRIRATVPMRRVAEAEDVAAAVLFLADERQLHVTGIDLPVSGGALLPLPRG